MFQRLTEIIDLLLEARRMEYHLAQLLNSDPRKNEEREQQQQFIIEAYKLLKKEYDNGI